MPMHVQKLKDFVLMQTNVGKEKQKIREREREREQNLCFCKPFEYFSLGNKVPTVTELKIKFGFLQYCSSFHNFVQGGLLIQC